MKNILILLLLNLCFHQVVAQELQILMFDSIDETKAFFRYNNLRSNGPIISGHRGGAAPGYPENALVTFEHTLAATPSVFEIDVRLTKDGQVVVLHDANLERSTTGKGKVKDYTLAELRELRLKDPQGNITKYGISTLEEAILWSKGKTLINLDVKDVPVEKKVELVKKHKAFAHVIFTIHSPEQARTFYDYDPRSMFSAFIKTKEDFQAYNAIGIPWENILMAYVGPWSKPENKDLYDLLHDKGVRVMVSAATSYDKLEDPEERAKAYRKIITDGADILESDRPIEAAAALEYYKR